MFFLFRLLRLALFFPIIAVCGTNFSPLQDVSVMVTAPSSYAPRLCAYLEQAGATVFCCPMIVTDFFPDESKEMETLQEAIDAIHEYDYVAFTSRKGIQALLRQDHQLSLSKLFSNKKPIAIALGVDSEALMEAGVEKDSILVPDAPTPQGIVELLHSTHSNNNSNNNKRTIIRILCPVPKVTGLTEPPVVPNFLEALRSHKCFHVDRVDAYETRWIGTDKRDHNDAIRLLKTNSVSVIAISSTAEVEGLLKLFPDLKQDCSDHAGIKVVAHGPVTAKGARALGVTVHGVSENSSSFAGMIGAIERLISKGN